MRNIFQNNLLKFIHILFVVNKKKFIITNFLVIILSIANFFMAFFLKKIITYFGNNTILLKFVLIYLLIQFSLSLIKKILQFYKFSVKEEAVLAINDKFLLYCSNMKFDEFEYSETYDTIQRLDSFINNRLFDFIENLFQFTESIVNIIISLLIVVTIDLRLIIIIIFLPFLSVRFYRKLNEMEYNLILQNTIKNRKSSYYSILLTKDYFFKDIKIQNTGVFIREKVFNIRREVYISKKKYLFTRVKYESSFYGLYTIILIAILFFTFEQNNYLINIGFFVFYLNIMSILNGSITQISKSLIAIVKNKYLIDEYYSITQTSKDDTEKKDILRIESIRFESVSFKYPKSKTNIINNVSFELNKGEVTILQGVNGAGKSTIIKLLSGLYENYEGKILINGYDMREINLINYQKRISVLFQDFNKYELSVLENFDIKATNSNFFDTAYNRYLQEVAGVDKLINSMKHKYFQQLGNWFSDGIQLSGGQWQKIALSRTIMKESDLYLLDEPTSMLDKASTIKFFDKINDIFSDCFCLVVTHDENNINEHMKKYFI